MIKPEEIRIGNYFYYKGIVTQFAIEDFNEANNNSQFLELFVKPIPLTEEWLVKFGFEKEEYSCPEETWDVYIIDEFEIHTDFANGIFANPTFLMNDMHNIKIGSIHQLQNLYHALTEKELEIK